MLFKKYKNQNNSVYDYLYDSSYFEIFIHNNTTTFARKSLYNDYVDYCTASGNKIIDGKATFYEQIRDSKLFEDIVIHGVNCFRYLGE